jgi:hypothetical protein
MRCSGKIRAALSLLLGAYDYVCIISYRHPVTLLLLSPLTLTPTPDICQRPFPSTIPLREGRHSGGSRSKFELGIRMPDMQAMVSEVSGPSAKKGWRFWLIFLAICTSLFLSAIEMVSFILVFVCPRSQNCCRRPCRPRCPRSSMTSTGTTSSGSPLRIPSQQLRFCLPLEAWQRYVTHNLR